MHTLDSTFLDLDTTLHDLPGYQLSAHLENHGQMLLDIFNQYPDLPGILILSESKLAGFVSRKAFFEHTGKRYGTEVFLNRSISFLLKKGVPEPLILPADTSLSKAARAALNRAELDVYEPVLEYSQEKGYRVINILTLFMAQNQILITLHNHKIDNLKAFMPMDETSAIHKFLRLAGIPSTVDLNNFKKIYHIHCPQCGQVVKYSITDIVRTYSNIQQGIEIQNCLGSRVYVFYVRHTCGDHIIDLPVQHDHNLEYRSIKPPRLVETYV